MIVFKGFQKGVNIGGWISQAASEAPDHLDTFIQEEDFKRIAGWDADHVRIPVDYMILEEEDGTFKESGFQYIDKCIAWSQKYGLHVLLDLHKTYGYTFDPLDHGDLEEFFHNKDYQARFLRLWMEMARRYGKYSDSVAFELLNEIVSPNIADEWNKIALHTIQQIRTIAPDTYIVYGGVRYNNVTSVALLENPHDDKVVFNFHCYDPLIFTHQKAYWIEQMSRDFTMSYPDDMEVYKEKSKAFPEELVKAILDTKAKNMGPEFFEDLFIPAIEAANAANVALYCSEYGVIDQAPVEDSVRWLKDINSVFVKYGIGRAIWNYKEKDYGLIDDHFAPVLDQLVKYL